jgi:CheY-like chemotaxis protein
VRHNLEQIATILEGEMASLQENFHTRSADISAPAENTRRNSDGGNSSILNSWKEIAHYLGRGVRTVQRWERDLGLPVHRPKGQDRSATLALTSELDQWLRETPVRSRSNGHSGNGDARNSSEDERHRLSVVRVEPSLVKDGHRFRRLILSVDDEPGLLYTREKILECGGYEVLSAADGERALDVLGTHAVDLVLLDYKMPGMDGGAVAREMKRRTPKVPIIMVSGNRVPGEALEVVDCFIPKGEGPELLLAAIHQLLITTTDTRKPTAREKLKRLSSVSSGTSRPIRHNQRRSS